MEISKTGYVNQLYPNETVQTQKNNIKEQQPAQTEPEKKDDVVNISSETKDLQLARDAAEASEGKRAERVSEIKKAYENGNYPVNAEQVANSLAGSILNEFV